VPTQEGRQEAQEYLATLLGQVAQLAQVNLQLTQQVQQLTGQVAQLTAQCGQLTAQCGLLGDSIEGATQTMALAMASRPQVVDTKAVAQAVFTKVMDRLAPPLPPMRQGPPTFQPLRGVR
jgi:hypothetical protein